MNIADIKEEWNFYFYSVIQKEDIYADIKEHIMDIMEDMGVCNPADYEDEIIIAHNNDLAADHFLDELEFMSTAYTEENGIRKLLPVFKMDDGTILSLEELQKNINSLSFHVHYLCREGKYGRSREYGDYYVTEPAYTDEVISPDIDVMDFFEELQKYADRHPESFLEIQRIKTADEPEYEI